MRRQYKVPWSVVQPFGSIKVNLTEASADGWVEPEDFPAQLQSNRLGTSG